MARVFGVVCAVLLIQQSYAATKVQGRNGKTVRDCVFPFKYDGNEYNACTDHKNNNRLWCAFVPDYTGGTSWGNCITVTLDSRGSGGQGAGLECQLPFKVQSTGTTHYDCIQSASVPSRSWCSVNSTVTSTGPRGKRIPVYTGGNLWAYCDKYVGPGGTTTTVATGTPSTTRPTTVITTSTTARPACRYRETRGRGLAGGTPYQAASTTQACRSRCNALPQCTGYEWTGNACWLNTNTNPQFNNNGNSNAYIKDCTGTTVQPTTRSTTRTVTTSTAPTTTRTTQTTTGSTSTVRTTPGGPCDPDGFQRIADRFSYEGKGVRSQTVTDCRNACLRHPKGCVAFDIKTSRHQNRQLPYCFLHLLGNGNYLDQVFPQTGTDQYRRNICTRVTTQPTPTCTYTSRPGYHSRGGTVIPNANSQQFCEAECSKREDTSVQGGKCYAYDYTPGAGIGQRCWILLFAGFGSSGSFEPLAGTTQYRKASCAAACKVTYRTVQGQAGNSGTPITNQQGVTACQAVCTNVRECVAIDVDANGVCYWHKAGYTTRSDSGVTHYIKEDSCATVTTARTTGTPVITTTGCVDQFDILRNQHSYDGQEQRGISTVSGCRNRCRNTGNCLGFDFDRKSVQCFFHTTTDYVAKRISNPNIDQYVRKPCVTVPPQSTTKPTSPGACVDTFTTVPNTNSYNGIPNPARSVTACQKACLDSGAYCYAVDYTTADTVFCYLHLRADYLTTSQVNNNNPDVTQYRRKPCSVSTAATTTVPGGGTTKCKDSWAEFVNRNYFGGRRDSSQNTLLACQERCSSIANCEGIDFVFSGNQCWLLLGSIDESMRGSPTGTNHYRRRRCDTTVTTRSTPAPPSTPGPSPSPSPGQTCTLSTQFGSVTGQPANSIQSVTLSGCVTQCLYNPNCQYARWEVQTPQQPIGRCDFYLFQQGSTFIPSSIQTSTVIRKSCV